MQKLTEKQALDILKAALDKSVKEGIFSTLNDVYTIVLAFDTVAKKVIDESTNDEFGQ
jgi:hypothetical protein